MAVDHTSRRMLKILLSFLYLLAAVFGCRVFLLEVPHLIDVLLSFAAGVTLAAICRFHSHVVGKRFVHAGQWVTVFAWPAAVPLYFIWAAGLRGLGLVLLHAVFLLLVAAGASLMTAFVI